MRPNISNQRTTESNLLSNLNLKGLTLTDWLKTAAIPVGFAALLFFSNSVSSTYGTKILEKTEKDYGVHSALSQAESFANTSYLDFFVGFGLRKSGNDYLDSNN
ncbi:hypothetical protein J4405_04555 [Candidatus Woesearchaeota archaeon]|nr:hypothetical protein [Candidatus Woesearchaeota archaeon]